MSYLSNPNIPLDLRTSAADAALAYVEALAHEESMFNLMNATSCASPEFDDIMTTFEEARDAAQNALWTMQDAVKLIAKPAPV